MNTPRPAPQPVPCDRCNGTGVACEASHAPDCTGERCSVRCPEERESPCPECSGSGIDWDSIPLPAPEDFEPTPMSHLHRLMDSLVASSEARGFTLKGCEFTFEQDAPEHGPGSKLTLKVPAMLVIG